MYFDRYDILAAWNLYLQHTHEGQGSEKYRRLCKLQEHFFPSGSEEFVWGLSDNAQEIYNNLMIKDS